MKKLLLLACIGFSASLSAQSFEIYSVDNSTVANGQTFTYWLPASAMGDNVLEFEVGNMASSSKTVKHISRKQLLGSSSSYYCTCTTCYSPSVDTSIFTAAIQPAAQCSLSSHFTWDGTVGTAIIRYTIYDVNNPADSAFTTVIYHATADPDGVPTLVNGESFVSQPMPNPAAQTVQLSYSVPAGTSSKMILTDISGRIISETALSSTTGTQQFDVSLLHSGLYFCRLEGEGLKPVTRKIVVAH